MSKLKQNKKLLILLITIISLFVLGGTYALYKLLLFDDLNVNVATKGLDYYLNYNKGDNFNGELVLCDDYTDGNNLSVTLYKKNNRYAHIYGHIYLKINNIGSNLRKSDALKYTVVDSNDNELNTGTLRGVNKNETILLTHNIDLGTTEEEYTVYIWLDKSEQIDNAMSGDSFSATLVVEATQKPINAEDFDGRTDPNAVQYITNLYTSAQKSTVTNNSITYNTAPSVHLMNDRLGGTTQSLDGGNIRYYGASDEVNNYVWLGETYTSAYTVRGSYYTYSGYSSVEECISDNGYEEGSEDALMYCGPDRVIPAGSKKLYRIIGVFNNKLKIITNESVGYYPWDTSSQDVNNGYGVNEWSQADLMKLLNPGYESESVNNSLYWNSSSGNCYNNWKNNYTACSFTNNGLSANVQSMISEETWYLGGHNTINVYANLIYEYERGNNVVVPGTTCSGNVCNDGIPRTITWQGKVALMYPSDYGYATDLNSCTQTLSGYWNSVCVANNWLHNWDYNWLLTPNSGGARSAWNVSTDGGVSYGSGVSAAFGVRPVLYLNSELTIESGSGTELDPYVIG